MREGDKQGDVDHGVRESVGALALPWEAFKKRIEVLLFGDSSW
jgi:hypothetical protein